MNGDLQQRSATERNDRGMKDATTATTTDLVDTGGGCSSSSSSSDGGGGGTTRSNSPSSSSPDMNTISPPTSITSPTAAALASAAAAAAFTSLHHSNSDGISPLLSHSQMFRNVPSAEVLRQTASLMAAGANRLSLQSSLISGSPLFSHHHSVGNLFSWPQTSSPPPSNPIVSSHSANNNNRMPMKTTTAKKNNNNVVSSSSAALTRKNQVNAKKRTAKKTDPAEPAIIEVAAMTHITNPAPLSPPTSGSSPPADVVSSGKGTNITSSEKDIMAGRDKSFVCRTCNRSFGYKHVLQNHERTHTGEKPFKCQVCEKRFTRDHHLKTHMRLHTGEKPYLCTHCDRQFVQVANLRRHLRVHTGERPYSCTECSSKFSDSNQLKAHTLIHRGEKPFECDKCQNKFRRRHHLMHHKCPGRDDASPIIINKLKENIRNRDQSSPENFDRNSRHGLLQNMIQNYSSVKDEVGDHYVQGEDNSVHMSRILDPTMTAIIRRKAHTVDLEVDEEDMMVEEEEDDEGVEEHEHLVNSHRNGLILSHNNNGSLFERKGRIRKPQDVRRVVRIPNSTSPPTALSPMLISMPLTTSLPEQTEPEDLSMSTGHQNGYRSSNHVHSNSHSSGDSPLSRSPSSGPDEEEDELGTKLAPSHVYLQHRHPKFRRHHETLQRNNGTAPVS
ncbi:hypothetical protein C0J52_01853 [Blattella germanica]|nr:hypothetical protein C0J52_01853 [Blattella germanica]